MKIHLRTELIKTCWGLTTFKEPCLFSTDEILLRYSLILQDSSWVFGLFSAYKHNSSCLTFSVFIFLSFFPPLLRLWRQRQTVFGLVMLLILLSIAYHIEGPHQKVTDLLMCCEFKNTIATVCDVTSLLQLQRRCLINYCNRVLKGTYFMRFFKSI